MPDLSHESACAGPVCGVDEVGRGPWAGPVVAAAVVLDVTAIPAGLDDSKRLSAARREELHAELTRSARWGVGLASVAEIDTLNILQASFLAMRRALAALGEPPAVALVPEIARAIELLRGQTGVRLARMSGSGATCFALFDDAGARTAAADAVRAAKPGWWCLETALM